MDLQMHALLSEKIETIFFATTRYSLLYYNTNFLIIRISGFKISMYNVLDARYFFSINWTAEVAFSTWTILINVVLECGIADHGWRQGLLR